MKKIFFVLVTTILVVVANAQVQRKPVAQPVTDSATAPATINEGRQGKKQMLPILRDSWTQP